MRATAAFNEVSFADFACFFRVGPPALDDAKSYGASESAAREQRDSVRAGCSAFLHLGNVEQPDRHSCSAVPQGLRSVTTAGTNGAIGGVLWLFLHGATGCIADAALGIQGRYSSRALHLRRRHTAVLASGRYWTIRSFSSGFVCRWMRIGNAGNRGQPSRSPDGITGNLRTSPESGAGIQSSRNNHGCASRDLFHLFRCRTRPLAKLLR